MNKSSVLSNLVSDEYAGRVEEWIAVWRKEITTLLRGFMEDYDGVNEWVSDGTLNTSPGKSSDSRYCKLKFRISV